MSLSLQERLDKIKSPNLQNQRNAASVLSAVEDSLREQQQELTPAGYFAGLLSLSNIVQKSGNKETATAVVYLLDVVTPFVPPALLRSEFTRILQNLAPNFTSQGAEAPLLRSSIGCLETLLLAQNSASWALSQSQVSPRRGVAGLLELAVDPRPKVRKRALEALTKVLQTPPPSPSIDHPAADMCAETALQRLTKIVQEHGKNRSKSGASSDHHPELMHALQLVKTIASAERGWPSKRIDALCEVLLNIVRASNEYLTMAAFEVFETVFEGMVDEVSSAKLPRLIEVITELRPSQNDAALLPPWIAVFSRGYDVSAQVDPEETLLKLPELFSTIAEFLTSMSHNIRVSAAECLVSFAENCIPSSVILEPSVYDEKTIEKIGKIATNLLSVKYQSAWMEVFTVLSALFDTLKWRAAPALDEVVRTIGELRASKSFTGDKEAESVLGKAIEAMGPEAVLQILPLNLIEQKPGQQGRVWLLPILRDNVINTNIAHFKSEMVPLSEKMFQKIIDFGNAEKTVAVKAYEMIVAQVWACLPGYCSLALDVCESFDGHFAELLWNVLYQKTELRVDICKSLQVLIEMNSEITSVEGEEDLILQRRISKDQAQRNLDHLSSLGGKFLPVLFNIYSETLPQYRGYILQSINAFLSITPQKELIETFENVKNLLEKALQEATPQTQADKQKAKQNSSGFPPTSHTLMDLVNTMSIHLPRSSYQTLFSMAAILLPQSSDPQLQKKAYKLIPRLAKSATGVEALRDGNEELQAVLLASSEKTSSPAKRDRLAALSTVIEYMPPHTLHFIPNVLGEVILGTKETNEKARTAAFNLLVQMGKKMAEGGKVEQSKVRHMGEDAPTTDASIEEYFLAVSGGLTGATPHMISATITALTRLIYEFHSQLQESELEELVKVIDVYLTSNDREIVRSSLGLVKVAIVSLPEKFIIPRMEVIVTGLIGWSHEHKNRFRVKVKHMLERLIRRFGFDTVDRYCPEADKKLLANIRKTRDRRKRRKEEAKRDGNEDDQPEEKRRGKFESEYDEVMNESDSDLSASDAEGDSDEEERQRAGRKGQKGGRAYIVEDEDEPLDLLDRRALGHISSTKPLKARGVDGKKKSKAKVNIDGKLILGGDEDADMSGFDNDKDPGDGTLEGGINAYVDAIRGKNAVQRGRGGKLKFSNRRDQEDAMEVDEEEVGNVVRKKNKPERRGLDGKKRGGKGQLSPRGGGGRVAKFRGRGRR